MGSGTALAGPRVQVRGSSRIEMHAFGPSDRLTITGTVRDEVGAPIPRARVVLSALVAPEVAVPWTGMYPCGRTPDAAFSEHTDHPVDADDSGSFCAVAMLGRANADLRAVYGGDGLHDGSQTRIVWDAAQRAMSLSFAPRPERVDLDVPHQKVTVKVSAPPDVRPGGLSLELRDERGLLLHSSKTDDEGLAVFDLSTSKLKGPGIGTLVVVFAGQATLAAATSSTDVTRTARVRLSPEADRIQGDPRSGVSTRVRASTSRGQVDDGSVEALLEGEVVGTAPVSEGMAEVAATFSPPRGADNVELTLRYAADSPFFIAGDAAKVSVRTVRSSAVVRLLPVVAAAIVAAWLLRGWRRPKRLERATKMPKQPAGVASIEVVSKRRTDPNWTGRVVDAHDGSAVAGARVRVLAPSFVDVDVIVEAHTDERGEFSLEVRSVLKDLRLRVESPLHAELERPLPAPSEMVISVVSRRRMLLQRLIDWARRAGKPWDQAPEPTPGQVARVARSQPRRHEVAAWAENLERKAFGPDAVDARAEREVRDLEPGRQPPR